MAGLLDPPLTPQQRYRKSKGLLADQFDRPTYYEHEPVERSELFPVGVYPGGQIGFAVPGILSAEMPDMGDRSPEAAMNYGRAVLSNAMFPGASRALAPLPKNAVGVFGGKLGTSSHEAANALGERPHRTASMSDVREWAEANGATFRDDVARTGSHYAYVSKPGMGTIKVRWGDHPPVYNDVGDKNFLDLNYSGLDKNAVNDALDWRFTTRLTPENAALSKAETKSATQERRLSPYDITQQKIVSGLQRSEDLRKAVASVKGAVVPSYVQDIVRRQAGVKHVQAIDLYNAMKTWEENPQYALFSNGGRPAAGVGLTANALADRPPGIRAYHGSPHDFDKFDMSKIGTGEGAQAYGHGLYFAENEGVAKGYRDNLGKFGFNVGDAPFDDKNPLHYAAQVLQQKGSREEAIKALAPRKSMFSDKVIDDPFTANAREILQRNVDIPPYQVSPNGKLYEVNIHAHPDDFLDWDKPLSQQSEKVRNAANKAWGGGLNEEHAGRMYAPTSPEMIEKFKQLGIPGTRYLDAGSRTAGEGSRNYVVFDPSLITILRKYGGGTLYSNGGRPVSGVGLTATALADRPPGIRAYHGSPHDFDKFDMTKIGTGEGAQAYGHGLYFAENEGVAKGYRDTLTQRQGITAPRSGKTPDETAALEYFNRYAKADDTLESFERKFKHDVGQELEPRTALDAWQAMVKDGRIKEANGRMYEVNIHAHPDDFLDWDKPLSQQSEKVRGALSSLGIADSKRTNQIVRVFQTEAEAKAASNNGIVEKTLDGKGFIARNGNGYVVEHGSGDIIPNKGMHVPDSHRLSIYGIPGTRYLDAGSRSAGEGSRNYVVFDDKLISILRKYGLLGMLGGAAAGGMLDGEAQKPKVDWKRSMLPGDA